VVNPHTFFKKKIALKITKVRKTFDLHADPKAKYFPHSFFSLYRTYKKEREKTKDNFFTPRKITFDTKVKEMAKW